MIVSAIFAAIEVDMTMFKKGDKVCVMASGSVSLAMAPYPVEVTAGESGLILDVPAFGNSFYFVKLDRNHAIVALTEVQIEFVSRPGIPKRAATPPLDLEQLEGFLIEALEHIKCNRNDEAVTAVLAAKFAVQLEMSRK